MATGALARLASMKRKYQYRRKLPHFQKSGHPLFVTFVTYKRWVLPPEARDIVLEVCRRADGQDMNLHAVVVMPDHVHLVLTPSVDFAGPISIPEIMKTLKSTSAHLINKALGHHGRVWQDESFDHVLRSDESLEAKVGYVIANPIRAGLVAVADEYRWLWSEFIV